MGLAHHPASLYQANEVNGADRIELILLMYKGAIKELRQARGSLDGGHIENRVRCINRACALIGELRTALDFDRGAEIAKSLDRLYVYMLRRLAEANLKRNGDTLEEIAGLLESLLPAWEQVRREVGSEEQEDRWVPSAVGNPRDRLSLSSAGHAGSTF